MLLSFVYHLQLGVILMRNGRAEKLIELNGQCTTLFTPTNDLITTIIFISSGNPRLHLKALDQVVTCSGDPSLQNALEMATRALR